MIDAINMPLNQKIPVLKNNAEIEHTAREFTSVFFSEYVGIMLDEAKSADDDFANDIYRTLHAQVIGKELVNSDPGRKITEMLISDINRMQTEKS